MRFIPLSIAGAFLIEMEPITDQRGYFARSFCRDEFKARGLAYEFVQCSIACNRQRGTLRGMHYNRSAQGEAKLMRCTRGALYDVLLDLRAGSPSYRRWIAHELTSATDRLIYAPPGVAHGYQTLEDDTEAAYWMSAPYRREAQAGVRWDDPAFGIQWPISRPILSARDRAYPDFDPA